MGVWTIVFIVVAAIILGGWILNARRLAKKNNNWERRSPTMFGRGGPPVDEKKPTRRGEALPAPDLRRYDQGTVACSTASVSAPVRQAVTSWYSGSATILLNASREG